MGRHGGLEDREGAGGEFVFLGRGTGGLVMVVVVKQGGTRGGRGYL